MSVLKELLKDGVDLVASINLRRLAVKLSITLVCIIVLVTGCTFLNKTFGIKDDNFIEEAVEEMIEIKTGMEIDLTPFSEENNQQ